MAERYLSESSIIQALEAIPEGSWKHIRFTKAIREIPAADVVERKTASWIEDGYNAGHLVCSKCGSGKPIAVESGRLASFEIKYCYFCGAKMDGGQDDA